MCVWGEICGRRLQNSERERDDRRGGKERGNREIEQKPKKAEKKTPMSRGLEAKRGNIENLTRAAEHRLYFRLNKIFQRDVRKLVLARYCLFDNGYRHSTEYCNNIDFQLFSLRFYGFNIFTACFNFSCELYTSFFCNKTFIDKRIV